MAYYTDPDLVFVLERPGVVESRQTGREVLVYRSFSNKYRRPAGNRLSLSFQPEEEITPPVLKLRGPI